jgi:hypothetical protein
VRIHKDACRVQKMFLAKSVHELLIHYCLGLLQIVVYDEAVVEGRRFAGEVGSLSLQIAKRLYHTARPNLNLF